MSKNRTEHKGILPELEHFNVVVTLTVSSLGFIGIVYLECDINHISSDLLNLLEKETLIIIVNNRQGKLLNSFINRFPANN